MHLLPGRLMRYVRFMLPAGDVIAALRDLPVVDVQELLGNDGPVLVVAPHPDDESLGCGGLIATCCARGREVHVLIVTDGSGSHPRSRAFPPPRLAALRADEARQAVGALGVPPDRLTCLGIRDGAAPHAGHGLRDGVQGIASYARRHGIGTICATWKHDPHPDHVAAYRMASGAAQQTGARLLSYPVWGWTLPNRAWLPVEAVSGARIDITPHLEAKRRAIACHRSQISDLIDDDPTAFRLQPDFLALLTGRYEVFIHG